MPIADALQRRDRSRSPARSVLRCDMGVGGSGPPGQGGGGGAAVRASGWRCAQGGAPGHGRRIAALIAVLGVLGVRHHDGCADRDGRGSDPPRASASGGGQQICSPAHRGEGGPAVPVPHPRLGDGNDPIPGPGTGPDEVRGAPGVLRPYRGPDRPCSGGERRARNRRDLRTVCCSVEGEDACGGTRFTVTTFLHSAHRLGR